MRAGVLLALAACTGGQAPVTDAPAVVRAWLDGAPGAAGGVVVVQVEADAAVSLELDEPEVAGLEFREHGEARVEDLGQRVLVTRRYRYDGAEGSYEIPGVTVRWTGPEGEGEANSSPLFVDLGVEFPRPGEPADIVSPGRVWTVPWPPWWVVVVAGLGSAGGLVALNWLTNRPAAPVPAVPPDIAALRAWEAVRADRTLSDHDKAVAISRIFREYAQAVLSFPAEAWTTSEILVHLGQLHHLPEGNVPRARRLLRATDRVKFAEARAGSDLFEELDADLRAFVATTRPHRWEEPTARGEAS